MRSLEQRFIQTLEAIELPEVSLVEPVLRELTAPTPIASHKPRRRLVVAAAAASFALLAVLAISPMRAAVADWFGIGATEIIVDPTADLPELSAATAELFGGVVVASPLSPLPQLGSPAAVLDTEPAGSRVYLWAASNGRPALSDTGVGVILSVRTISGPLATKRMTAEVGAAPVDFVSSGNAVTGIWIDGDHAFTPGGSTEPLLAGRVLLWTLGTVQYRLEANLDLAAMTELAGQVQGGTNLLPSG